MYFPYMANPRLVAHFCTLEQGRQLTTKKPFKEKYPINPSWEIAVSLPPLLPPSRTSNIPRIRILVHPFPIRVSYTAVRDVVPKLWASVPRVDIIVHVGMAASRNYYSVERRGHRDGYAKRDVDGVFLSDERDGGGKDDDSELNEKWIWEDCPEELVTDVDVEDVLKRWRMALPVSSPLSWHGHNGG
jgi:pyroglutamyl-peptidase